MPDADHIQARPRAASCVPQALAAGFSAFEVIRRTARAHEGRVPALFAVFMTAADAAVTGREALTSAPSMPAASATESSAPAPAATVDDVLDALAGLGALLSGHLAGAAATAQIPGDKAALEQAAGAASQIRDLMTRGHGDRGLR
jgi:hypothetical protein